MTTSQVISEIWKMNVFQVFYVAMIDDFILFWKMLPVIFCICAAAVLVIAIMKWIDKR